MEKAPPVAGLFEGLVRLAGYATGISDRAHCGWAHCDLDRSD